MFDDVRSCARDTSKRSPIAVYVRRTGSSDDNNDFGVQRVEGLFIDLPVDVEDGIWKHWRLSEFPMVPRCPVQSEMVMVDEFAYLGWEVKEPERWPFKEMHNVYMETSERLDGGRYSHSLPQPENNDSQDRDVNQLMKESAIGRSRLVGFCGDHDFFTA